MDIICLEERAFYALIEMVVDRLLVKYSEQNKPWITDQEVMQLLNIKSKTTLQNLRDEGKIRFSHPQKKIILYDRNSIYEYLENNVRNTF